MNPLYLPVINQGDFEAFRKIMHDELPPRYSEWRDRHANRLAEYSKMNRIVEVEVKPNDFARYVNSGSYGANAKTLLDFAEVLGKRNQK